MFSKLLFFIFRLLIAIVLIPVAFFIFNLLCIVYIVKLYYTGNNDIEYFVDYVRKFNEELKNEELKNEQN